MSQRGKSDVQRSMPEAQRSKLLKISRNEEESILDQESQITTTIQDTTVASRKKSNDRNDGSRRKSEVTGKETITTTVSLPTSGTDKSAVDHVGPQLASASFASAAASGGGVNVQPKAELSKPGYDSQGAAYYICVVIVVYALSLLLFIISLVKRRNRDKRRLAYHQTGNDGLDEKRRFAWCQRNRECTSSSSGGRSNSADLGTHGTGVGEDDRVVTVFGETSTKDWPGDPHQYRPLRVTEASEQHQASAADSASEFLSTGSDCNPWSRPGAPGSGGKIRRLGDEEYCSIDGKAVAEMCGYSKARPTSSSCAGARDTLRTSKTYSNVCDTSQFSNDTDVILTQPIYSTIDIRNAPPVSDEFRQPSKNFDCSKSFSNLIQRIPTKTTDPCADELITLVQVLPSSSEEELAANLRETPSNKTKSPARPTSLNISGSIKRCDGVTLIEQEKDTRCRWSIGADGNIWILQVDAAAYDKDSIDYCSTLPKDIYHKSSETVPLITSDKSAGIHTGSLRFTKKERNSDAARKQYHWKPITSRDYDNLSTENGDCETKRIEANSEDDTSVAVNSNNDQSDKANFEDNRGADFTPVEIVCKKLKKRQRSDTDLHLVSPTSDDIKEPFQPQNNTNPDSQINQSGTPKPGAISDQSDKGNEIITSLTHVSKERKTKNKVDEERINENPSKFMHNLSNGVQERLLEKSPTKRNSMKYDRESASRRSPKLMQIFNKVDEGKQMDKRSSKEVKMADKVDEEILSRRSSSDKMTNISSSGSIAAVVSGNSAADDERLTMTEVSSLSSSSARSKLSTTKVHKKQENQLERLHRDGSPWYRRSAAMEVATKPNDLSLADRHSLKISNVEERKEDCVWREGYATGNSKGYKKQKTDVDLNKRCLDYDYQQPKRSDQAVDDIWLYNECLKQPTATQRSNEHRPHAQKSNFPSADMLDQHFNRYSSTGEVKQAADSVRAKSDYPMQCYTRRRSADSGRHHRIEVDLERMLEPRIVRSHHNVAGGGIMDQQDGRQSKRDCVPRKERGHDKENRRTERYDEQGVSRTLDRKTAAGHGRHEINAALRLGLQCDSLGRNRFHQDAKYETYFSNLPCSMPDKQVGCLSQPLRSTDWPVEMKPRLEGRQADISRMQHASLPRVPKTPIEVDSWETGKIFQDRYEDYGQLKSGSARRPNVCRSTEDVLRLIHVTSV